jgi:hypothetical protein
MHHRSTPERPRSNRNKKTRNTAARRSTQLEMRSAKHRQILWKLDRRQTVSGTLLVWLNVVSEKPRLATPPTRRGELRIERQPDMRRNADMDKLRAPGVPADPESLEVFNRSCRYEYPSPGLAPALKAMMRASPPWLQLQQHAPSRTTIRRLPISCTLLHRASAVPRITGQPTDCAQLPERENSSWSELKDGVIIV